MSANNVDQSEARKMLKELLDDESDLLTAWEIEFIDSLKKQAFDITPRQLRTLDRIWDKVFG
jgi:hypothetical protein